MAGQRKKTRHEGEEDTGEEDYLSKRSKRVRAPVDFREEDEGEQTEEECESLECIDGRSLKESQKFETGVITKIYMEDFMCHQKFSISLCRRVNFITGQNGSGKSAIVAAIQLCLGSTARNTGRGDNMSKLIREGCAGPAIVRVTLLNEGADSYRPDEYKKRICIERRILQKGGGGYRILDEDGKVVSRDRAELENILRNFNIFVENPCCVLTQEESKKFIQGNEHNKYDFFLKATGLERLSNEIKDIGEALDKSKVSHESSRKKLEERKGTVEKYKKELQKFESLAEFELKINECTFREYWREVFDKENAVRVIAADKDKKVKAFDDCVRNLDRFNELYLEDDSELEKYRVENEDVQRQIEEVKLELTSFSEKALQAQRECNDIAVGIKTLDNSIQEQSRRLNVVRKEISEIRQKASEDAQVDTKRILAEMLDLSSNLDQVTADLSKCLHERAELVRYKEADDAKLSDCRLQYEECKNAIRNLESTKNTRGSETGKEAAFGKYIPDILRLLSREKSRFQGNVFGPLGFCIKLRGNNEGSGQGHYVNNDNLSRPVEKCTGAVLKSFVVTNTHDRNLLSKILKSFQGADREHKIIVQPPSKNRYTVPSIANGFTVLDALIIESDIIFNVLVDQCNIEGVVIVRDEQECDSKFVIRDQGKDAFIPNVRQAITWSGTTIKYRRGNRASEMMRDYQYQRLLVTDASQIVEQIEAELVVKRNQFRELEGVHRAVQQGAQGRVSKIQQCESRIRALENDKRTLTRSKNELENRIRELNARDENGVDTTFHEQEERELVEAIGLLTSQLEEKNGVLNAARKGLDEFVRMKKNAERKKSGLQLKLREAETKLEDYVNNQMVRKDEGERLRERVLKSQKLVEDVVTAMEKAMAEAVEVEKSVRERCCGLIEGWSVDSERPEEVRGETRDKIRAKKERLIQQLDVQRKIAGVAGQSKESVMNSLQQAIQDYQKYKTDFELVSQTLSVLAGDWESRQRKWENALKSSSRSVRRHFDNYMQDKGQSGMVEFDHTDRVLKVLIQTDNQDVNTQCNDVRQLSGGERSFSTLCLLLALGHVIESPFRIMDEYDVFLDQHARQLTLQQLQQYALAPEQRGRQFIIVTPQDLSSLQTSTSVKIHRMKRPERQSAHGLQQTTIG